ncbi:Peptidoglycan/xylan/chitin deacetylase, PgdA/CDA1 family [Halobacillus karajensis]|uniref:polysaccharide deacetylase family protein n=1 Tax=Halobacillus karajensis TaxID=195088 RepID=UPI0008A79F96|nr:polysaccharide deacetylase family protein [Halobacillus karajensis]SEH50732.1 Peptidoglycan/xylan/chitin deacetylase, PgdA/CDA1 family [Halobacillus karajensis]
MKLLRRLRWPSWFIITLLVVGVAWFGLSGGESNSSEAMVKVEQEEMSHYPGLDLQTRTTESDLYTTSISIPKTKSNKINQTIQEWLDKQKQSFVQSMNGKDSTSQEDVRGHLNIQVDTEQWAENKYSLILSSYQFSGGANGSETVKTFVMDLEKDRLMKLEDVMKTDAPSIKAIQAKVEEQLRNDKGLEMYLMEDDLQKALSEPSTWKWSLSNETLTLYFDEYEIAAGAAGLIQVDLPLENIRDQLKKSIIDEMKLPKKPESPQTENNPNPQVELDDDAKYIALTFDDGPHPEVTPAILQTLKEHESIATFFMLGSQVEYYPEVAKQVAEAGHEIGNHSESHMDLSQLSPDKIIQELDPSSEIIEEVTGQKPKLFRPPYGAVSESVETVANERGTPIINWSIDSLDWQSLDADSVIAEVERGAASGAIVLMHDIHRSTAAALPELLDKLEKEGYQFVTVSQLLELQDKNGMGPYYGKVL